MNLLFFLLCTTHQSLAFETVHSRNPTARLLGTTLQAEVGNQKKGIAKMLPSLSTKPKVLIVGAGFSGLAVAYHLRNVADCLILEARGRIGGRVHPMEMNDGTIVDLGGQWIHEASQQNPIVRLLKEELNIPMLYASLERDDNDTSDSATKGNSRQSIRKNIMFDSSGQEIPSSIYKSASKFFYKVLDSIDPESTGLNTSWKDVFDGALEDASSPKYHRLAGQNIGDPRFQAILNYLIHRVECYEGGRFHELSSHLSDIYQNLGGPDEIPTGGYRSVLQALAGEIGSDKISLNTPVATIDTNQEEKVQVTCRDGSSYLADFCVCTVPLGVLQRRSIVFRPDLPSGRWKAIDSIGMGLLDKVILKFDEDFWSGLEVFGVVHEEVSRIQHFYDCSIDFGAPTLVLFLGGDAARRVDSENGLTDKEISSEAMRSLRLIFGNEIPDPLTTVVTRWLLDEYSYGAYSFAKVGCTKAAYEEVAQPIGNVFFAGEHTSLTAHSCVHGAWGTGEREAKRILDVIHQMGSRT